MTATVIVLGAGATHGADFRTRIDRDREVPERHPGAPLPALDADFFDRLLHVSDGNIEHDGVIRQAVADARWVAVGSTYPTLEAMFTYIEAADHKHIGPAKINGRRPVEVRSTLVRAVALQLGSALCNADAADVNDAHYHCKHHTWLARPTKNKGPGLNDGDTIISFNYDCLMDFALARNSHCWNASIGYELTDLTGWEKWTQGDGRKAPRASLRLLKMHGSLNWKRCSSGSGIALTGHNYIDVVDPCIVPPDWTKTGLHSPPYAEIWEKAANALKRANSIVFIGYSMPVTDLGVQAFFRAARLSAESRLERIVIVNPDEAAHQRTVQLFKAPLDDQAQAVRLKSWAEFKSLSASVWHR